MKNFRENFENAIRKSFGDVNYSLSDFSLKYFKENLNNFIIYLARQDKKIEKSEVKK